MEKQSFQGTVTIITGAASGMGRYMALQAAQRRAHVIAVDVNAVGLEETKTMAPAIEIKTLDIADKSAIESFARAIIPQLNNRKLILINNAGVSLLSGGFEFTPLEDFEWLVNINLWGAIRLTKAFYPYLLEHGEGHIVNVSSVFGLAGVANNSAYCTAKFGLRGFTETLRMELMGTGVGTTSVHPGGIKTNIVKNGRTGGDMVTDEMFQNTVKRFNKMALTTAEDAAKQILDAVEKKQDKLVIGPDGRLLNLLVRLFPVSYTKIVRRRMDKLMEGVAPVNK